MSTMSAIVLIVAIIVFGKVISNRHRHDRDFGPNHEDHRQIGPSPREREMEAELKQLRERVQVLERIATDDRDTRRLADEIEQLRHQEGDNRP